jgi:hypothetical protein
MPTNFISSLLSFPH